VMEPILAGEADSTVAVVDDYGYFWTKGNDTWQMQFQTRARRQDRTPWKREAGNVYGVGLVEGAAVDADAEVSPCCIGEACAGPEEEKPHGTGEQGGNAEGDGERQQQLGGARYARGLDVRLRCGETEYPLR